MLYKLFNCANAFSSIQVLNIPWRLPDQFRSGVFCCSRPHAFPRLTVQRGRRRSGL